MGQIPTHLLRGAYSPRKLASMAPFARLNAVVLDCPDPRRLSAFYGEITGWHVEYDEPEWVTLASGSGLRLCFQETTDYIAPRWLDPVAPQQAHLDFAVEDLDEAQRRVVELGATLCQPQPGDTWRVFLDPAGHPFCLYEEG